MQDLTVMANIYYPDQHRDRGCREFEGRKRFACEVKISSGQKKGN